nr:unnamed protein product [Callosobruchus chinensis]
MQSREAQFDLSVTRP